MLRKEEIIAALPPKLRSSVSDDLTNTINRLAQNPEESRAIEENFVTYANVLSDGRYKIQDYLNAVAYVSYKLMDKSDKEAYSLTFPKRVAKLMSEGKTNKEISSYVSHYNKNKLVNAIFEQSHIPSWVLHQGTYNKAIKTQYELMTDPTISPKVRSDAANSVLTHLKRPETKELNVNFGVQESSGLAELKQMMASLAEQQLKAIDSGTPTREIAHQSLKPLSSDIVDAEYLPVGNNNE